MAPDGVMRCKAHNRMTLEERWNPEGFEDLKGYPWMLRPTSGKEAKTAEKPMMTGSEAIRPQVVIKEVVADTKPRELYVLQSDLDEFGYTDGCEACTNIALFGRSVVKHNGECRTRIQKQLEQAERGRLRLDKWKLKTAARESVVSPASPAEQGVGSTGSLSGPYQAQDLE